MSSNRRYYTVNEKLSMLSAAETLQNDGTLSFRRISAQLGVQPSQLRRWKRQFEKLQTYHASERRHAKALHRGSPSQLAEIEVELLQFITKSRDEGTAVSIRMVMMKAAELDPTFGRKSSIAKDTAVRRFVKSHGLHQCVKTYQSQQSAAPASRAKMK